MNNVTTFINEKYGQVRVVYNEDEVWFAGKDVAAALGYVNTRDALISHVDEEDKRILKRSEIMTLENHIPKEVFPVNFVSADVPNRGLTIINESGLYSLVLSSKLPTAKEFKRWVTSEILPSIRRHGAYLTSDKLEEVLLNPDVLISLAQQLKAEQEKVKRLQPKADYYDTVANTDGTLNFRETAKLLGVKERTFINYLLLNRYVYRNSRGYLVPMANYQNTIFTMNEVTYGSADNPQFAIQTRITNYGRTKLFERMKKDGMI